MRAEPPPTRYREVVLVTLAVTIRTVALGLTRWVAFTNHDLLFTIYGFMKRCPRCEVVYPDDSLRFCRNDGAELEPATAEDKQTLVKLPSLGGAAPAPTTGSLPQPATLPRLSQLTFAEAIEEYPAWSANGDEIAFSREEAGIRSIFVKRLTSGEERRVTSSDNDEIQPAWSPDAKAILFVRARQPNVKLEPGDVFGSFADGDIWSLDLASRKETRLIENAFNPDYSPDGKRIAFDASWAGPQRIWAVDSRGYNPQQLTSDSSEGISHLRPRWSPDGTKVVFQSIERTKFDVRVIDLTRGRSIWVTNDAVQDLNPVWSPSGRFIYFSSYRGGGIWSPDCKTIAFNSDRTGEMNIWLHSVETGLTRQLTKGSGGDFQANWSPDGRRIAFFSSRAGTADLWCVEVESGELQQLTKADSVDVNPFFSPDGEMIAYNSDQSGRPEVWVMNADGSNARQLTDVGLGLMGHFMRWQPGSDAVIFRCPGGGNPVTMKVRLDGSDPEPLPEVAGGSHMSFSPDHSRIMDVIGHKALWVSPLDGGKPEKVFEFDDPDVRIDYPVWSPDGRWILFDRFRPQGGDIWMMEHFE